MLKWIKARRNLIACTLLGLFLAGVALDLFLVLVLHAKSISMATWIATQAHPTIQVAIVLAGYALALLIEPRWRTLLAATAVGLACHLGTHW